MAIVVDSGMFFVNKVWQFWHKTERGTEAGIRRSMCACAVQQLR